MPSSHQTLLGLSLWALLLCRVPAQAETLPQFHERLTWSAPVEHRGRAHYTLEYWAKSRTSKGHDLPTECLLRTRLTRILAGRKRVWEGKDVYTDPKYAQVSLAVAIRVHGQEVPQILVVRDRDNWGDYDLYRMDEHGLKETFGFSHRDPGCIRWVSHKGNLRSFDVTDRWDGRLHTHEPPGKRWQNRLVYRYDKSQKTWKPVSRRLEAYVFDDQNGNLKNLVFEKPRDCPFRF